MKYILRRQIISLIASILILVVCTVTLVWFMKSMTKKVGKVNSVKEQIASYENNKKAFQEESIQISKIADHTKELENYVLSPNSTPDLLSQIEGLASSIGVEFAITAVNTTSTAEDTNKKLIIDFSTKGTNAEIENFLYLIKHQPYQVQFLKISITRESSDQNNDLWQLTASMQIVSY